jgi:hypothetical protein
VGRLHRLLPTMQSPRDSRAEKRRIAQDLEQERKRVKHLENELNVLKNDDQYMSLEDLGGSFYQDAWNQTGCSRAVNFTSPVSFVCPSVEEEHSLACMPGVHGQTAMDKGMYSQSIWLKGTGYVLAGFVSSDAEKDALKRCDDWRMLPLMQNLCSENAVTLHVDMVTHTAKLYNGNSIGPERGQNLPGEKLEASHVWENLPPKVRVAVAMKRNTNREIVLLPCSHWDVQEIGG